jgi:hypothetical protein
MRDEPEVWNCSMAVWPNARWACWIGRELILAHAAEGRLADGVDLVPTGEYGYLSVDSILGAALRRISDHPTAFASEVRRQSVLWA